MIKPTMIVVHMITCRGIVQDSLGSAMSSCTASDVPAIGTAPARNSRT